MIEAVARRDGGDMQMPALPHQHLLLSRIGAIRTLAAELPRRRENMLGMLAVLRRAPRASVLYPVQWSRLVYALRSSSVQEGVGRLVCGGVGEIVE